MAEINFSNINATDHFCDLEDPEIIAKLAKIHKSCNLTKRKSGKGKLNSSLRQYYKLSELEYIRSTKSRNSSKSSKRSNLWGSSRRKGLKTTASATSTTNQDTSSDTGYSSQDEIDTKHGGLFLK